MIEMSIIFAAALIIAGIAIGGLAIISLGIRREEKAARRSARRFTRATPYRTARGARIACGVHMRFPG